MFDSLKKRIAHWYLQYELITCIYMFEPWEKRFLHTLAIVLGSLIGYSSYTYLPGYMISLWNQIKTIIPVDP